MKRCVLVFCCVGMIVTTLLAPHIHAESLPTGTAHAIEEGVIDCFEEGLTFSDGKLIFCEASAVVYDGSNLVFAMDKPMPDEARSSIFTIKYEDQSKHLSTVSLRYFTETVFIGAKKYEGLSITPDAKHIIATTAFNKVKPNSARWNNYNTLLFWPVGKPEEAKIISPSTVDGITSSISLRQKIISALKSDQFPDGPAHFKIEGLAVIPDNRLLFGIREIGKGRKQYDYAFIIVQVTYKIVNDEFILADDFKKIYDFDSSLTPQLKQQVALSSLEYDPYHDRLYLVTSYEVSKTDEGLGGYLWILALADLEAGKAPRLVLKDKSSPLLFPHKAEGLAVLSASRVFIIHDDDRVVGRDKIEDPEIQFSKKPHQAAYTIVEFAE